MDATYDRTKHSAAKTDDYVFHQLIPYLGNKRKLLGLIGKAIDFAGISPGDVFLDLFAGSGVVSRYAKRLGLQVVCNDWEPYAEQINRCYIECNGSPYLDRGYYKQAIRQLNSLPPLEGWITRHLCPRDDDNFDTAKDRMFFMRKNGMRIDAIRAWIKEREDSNRITRSQKSALLAPLLHAACYVSNTSGVFKGFHNGWGGKTGTALYRIKSDLQLHPAVFCGTGADCRVFRLDAIDLANDLAESRSRVDFAYLDPPYNQHPFGSNYHVLNTITLADEPELSPTITGRGDKSGIRKDWRTERRSLYNYRASADLEYRSLLNSLEARFIATSYSTDGMIPLETMIRDNLARGEVTVFTQGYKRYRVSTQRSSAKPLNIEFVILCDTSRESQLSVEEIVAFIQDQEMSVLSSHGSKV